MRGDTHVPHFGLFFRSRRGVIPDLAVEVLAEVTAEVTAEVAMEITAEVLAEVIAEVLIKLTSGAELDLNYSNSNL